MRKALYVGKLDWEILKNLFHAHYARQFKLDQSLNFKDVIDKICSGGSYDLYLLDCDEKDIDPMQLWRDIVELGGERPAIFIGSPNILSTRIKNTDREEFQDIEFLERPVKKDSFKASVDDSLEQLSETTIVNNTVEGNEEEFLPVKLRSFYLNKKIEFDAYAKIMPGKFLKVINKDQRYTISYLQSYLKKGLKHLYLKKDDRLKHLDNASAQVQIALEMPELTLKRAIGVQSKVWLNGSIPATNLVM